MAEVIASDLFLDRNGNPISTKEWREKISDISYRTVAYTEINLGWPDQYAYVSTIWTGVNGGSKRIFETVSWIGDKAHKQASIIKKQAEVSEKDAVDVHRSFVKSIKKTMKRDGQ